MIARPPAPADFAPLPGPVQSIKIVYWGPGRSGKTTNLVSLHDRIRPELRGKLVTLDGPGERTLYFDCLPLELRAPGGSSMRLRLYTVPGQPRFRLTRRLVLQGVDGLVFVWDGRPRRLRANIDSLLEARQTLAGLGCAWSRLPKIFQLNKQDLEGCLSPERCAEILAEVGEGDVPRIPASALRGIGVVECLSAIARAALRRRMVAGIVPGIRVQAGWRGAMSCGAARAGEGSSLRGAAGGSSLRA